MTTAQELGNAVSASLETSLSLRPFECNWLLASGVPADSIQSVPPATLRELYNDILQIGPNYEVVQQWQDYLACEMASGIALYHLTKLQDEATFIAFTVQMSDILNHLNIGVQGDLWRLMTSAERISRNIIKDASPLFPATRREEYNTQDVIREMKGHCFHSILILSTGGMLPEGSEAEQLRQLIYPAILENMSQAGAN